jgi:hypothetical protein
MLSAKLVFSYYWLLSYKIMLFAHLIVINTLHLLTYDRVIYIAIGAILHSSVISSLYSTSFSSSDVGGICSAASYIHVHTLVWFCHFLVQDNHGSIIQWNFIKYLMVVNLSTQHSFAGIPFFTN